MQHPIHNLEKHAVIFFDGECNVCSWSVRFIINRDKKGYFLFASLQSEVAESLLAPNGVSAEQKDSIVLMEGDGHCFTASTAVLRICRRLDGFWKGLYLLSAIPKVLRDPAYRLFARNRYRFFGRRRACMVPNPEIKRRFLEKSDK